MKGIKVPTEFSRRIRNVDFANYKAEEYRNLGLFFFINVSKAFPDSQKKHKKLWLLLGYLYKGHVLPDSEYANYSQADTLRHKTTFYKMYEATFGPENCTCVSTSI